MFYYIVYTLETLKWDKFTFKLYYIMYNINFISSAYDKSNKQTYSNFLIPFAFFAIFTNKNSHEY
jgi:hypothetical protein